MSQIMDDASTDEDGVESGQKTDRDGANTESESESVEDPSSESIPLDQIFGILKNQRRRYVLQYLYQTDGRISLSEVAEQIAAWENDKEVRQITSSERKRVYVGLYQCHLPKMDGAGVISFNKPRGIIELGEHADAVYTYLETGEETTEQAQYGYPMVLSLAGAGVLGLSLVVQSVIALPVVEVAVLFVVCAFLLYSGMSLHRMRKAETNDTA